MAYCQYKLTLNKDKPEFMIIGSRQRSNQISSNLDIDNQMIKRVPDKKVLGVIIDEQLKWKEHNDEQCKKITKAIALIKKSKTICNPRRTTKDVQCPCSSPFHLLLNYLTRWK